MQIAALASPPLAIALLTISLSGDLARPSAPVLFAQTVASLTVAYLSSVAGDMLGVVAAAGGGLLACAGLIAVVLTIDARLTAKGNANGDASAIRPWLWLHSTPRWREFEHHFWASVGAHTWAGNLAVRSREGTEQDRLASPGAESSSENLYSLKREGRLALFVFVRRDRLGRLLEAAAYDPEDYT
jgi:hypothetical protein